ncbi:MAG: hypothetical protein ACYC35_12660 [Pirellulales bacterium]
MEFHSFTTMRDWTRRAMPGDRLGSDIDHFYQQATSDALRARSAQFLAQILNERDWERGKRPYYNVYPSIIPMLTRLDLDLETSLIHVPLPALCVRLPKDQAQNPLKFDWKGKEIAIRCMLLGEINDGGGISVLIDIGETMPEIGFPIYTYRNFRRREGLTVEDALRELKTDWSAEMGIAVPSSVIDDCVRLCCSLCLLENDPEVISPDVLADDRSKYETSGDQKYVDKAHRRGKIGWDVGRHIEVIPHYRRPHMALVWTGRGRVVPKIVPRRGSVVHREVVEKLPSGFGGMG